MNTRVLALPEPGPGEVRVRITFSGVNPGDTKKRQDWLGYGMSAPRIVPHDTGLGHPEGPYELDDGRVIYANTYASEIGVWDPKTGKAGTFAKVGGVPGVERGE